MQVVLHRGAGLRRHLQVTCPVVAIRAGVEGWCQATCFDVPSDAYLHQDTGGAGRHVYGVVRALRVVSPRHDAARIGVPPFGSQEGEAHSARHGNACVEVKRRGHIVPDAAGTLG